MYSKSNPPNSKPAMVMSYTSMLEVPKNQYLPMAVSYGAFQSGGLRFGRSLFYYAY